jgi:hypothetical protein
MWVGPRWHLPLVTPGLTNVFENLIANSARFVNRTVAKMSGYRSVRERGCIAEEERG